jgi:hypothetical protein
MDSDTTTPITSTTSSASRSRSRASRIITVKHRSVFYPLVILFVLANILHFALGCTLLGLLFAWLLLVFLHARNPTLLGQRLGSRAERTIDRIRAFPPELLLILAIIYITFASKLPFPPADTWLAERWPPIIYTLALVFGASLDHVGGTRPRPNRGVRNWLKRVFSRRSGTETVAEQDETQDVTDLEPVEPERMDTAEIINSMSEEEEAWHRAQQERWKNWIAEETERFRGDFH